MISKMKLVCLVIFFMLVIVILAYFFVSNNITFEDFRENRDIIKDIVRQHHYSCLIIILIGYVLSAFGIPITPLLTIFTGFLFGWILGVIYSITSITIGGVLTFIFTRYMIGDYIWNKYKNRIEQINSHIEEDVLRYFISLRLIPFLPICILNYAGGLSGISLEEFTISTVIGKLPYCIVYALAGDNIMDIDNASGVYSIKTIVMFIFLAIIALAPILYNNKYFKERSKDKINKCIKIIKK
ncbi:VTT domain-containing protein [Clostridiaceae bacterium M8S5]|nr:VTT domain-containing protein [Clostridiaceae bacterium M8S5]